VRDSRGASPAAQGGIERRAPRFGAGRHCWCPRAGREHQCLVAERVAGGNEVRGWPSVRSERSVGRCSHGSTQRGAVRSTASLSVRRPPPPSAPRGIEDDGQLSLSGRSSKRSARVGGHARRTAMARVAARRPPGPTTRSGSPPRNAFVGANMCRAEVAGSPFVDRCSWDGNWGKALGCGPLRMKRDWQSLV